MPDPRDENPQFRDLYQEDRPNDGIVSYSVLDVQGEITSSSHRGSTRWIEITILDDDEDEIEAQLDVVDNTIGGVFSLFGSKENYPPEDQYAEFSKRVAIDKSEIPYYQDDFPDVKSHIPIAERLTPWITEWSREQPFRA